MKQRRHPVASLALALVAVCAAANCDTGVESTMPLSPTDLPVIRMALGDEYETIRRKSTFSFPSRSLTRIDVISTAEPVILEYTGPECRLILPPARSFAAAVNDSHAVSVTVSPQLAYVSTSDALDLVKAIQRLLGQGGWQLARRYLSPDNVRARFADAAQDSDITLRIEDWQCGGDEVYIELARHWRQGDSLPRLAQREHDLCVVTIKLENDAVRARYPGR
jgi:hypothetical protein